MVSPDSTPPKWSRRPPQASVKRSTTGRLLMVAAVAFVLGFVIYRLFLQTSLPPGRVKPPTVPATPAGPKAVRLVTLFYPLADGSGLSGIIQKRPICPDESTCLEDLLSALAENPGAGLFPLLPLHRGPKSVSITGPTATINFSRETVQHLPGGVQSERLLLAALVDTLAVNFPQVQQLAIEIDGIPAETLKGHVDLTTPFVADFSLVRRPLLPSFPVQPGTSSERSP